MVLRRREIVWKTGLAALDSVSLRRQESLRLRVGGAWGTAVLTACLGPASSLCDRGGGGGNEVRNVLSEPLASVYSRGGGLFPEFLLEGNAQTAGYFKNDFLCFEQILFLPAIQFPQVLDSGRLRRRSGTITLSIL